MSANPLADEVRTTARSAFVEGMTHAMLIGAIIMFCAVVLVLVLLPHHVQSPKSAAPEAAAGD